MTDLVTRLDQVLPALVEIVREAVGPLATDEAPIEVLDGPRLGELPWRVVVIGLTDTPDTPPYTTRYEAQDGLGRPRYVEVASVRCLVSVARGDDDLLAARAEAIAIVAALAAALRDHHTNPGVWDGAGFAGDAWAWYPMPTENGATVAVFFSLEVETLL